MVLTLVKRCALGSNPWKPLCTWTIFSTRLTYKRANNSCHLVSFRQENFQHTTLSILTRGPYYCIQNFFTCPSTRTGKKKVISLNWNVFKKSRRQALLSKFFLWVNEHCLKLQNYSQHHLFKDGLYLPGSAIATMSINKWLIFHGHFSYFISHESDCFLFFLSLISYPPPVTLSNPSISFFYF